MTFLAKNSERWFSRAETLRAVAGQLNDPEAKRIMLVIAEGYEKLAQYSKAREIPGRNPLGQRPDLMTRDLRL